MRRTRNMKKAAGRSARRAPAPLVLACLLASSAGAQGLETGANSGFDRGIRIITGVRYESFDEHRSDVLGQRLGQLNVYGLVTTLCGPNLRFDFASGWNATNWHSLGDLSTLDDSRFDVAWRPTEHLMLGGGINIPTGRTNLDFEAARLAQGVASRLKGYQTSKFGEGTDFDARASYGVRVGGIGLAAAAGWLVKGHYTMLEGQGAYDPGDQVTLSLGTEVGSTAQTWRTVASYTLYAHDELDGATIFEFGNRLRLETTYRRRATSLLFLARARAVFRADSQRLVPDVVLQPEAREAQGAELYVDQTTDISLGASPFGLLLLSGMRVFDVNERGTGSGHRIDAGGGLRLGSKTVTLEVRGRGSFGRIDVTNPVPGSTGGRRSFTGWSVDGSLTRRGW